MIDKNTVKSISLETSQVLENELRDQAFGLFDQGYKNIQVASQLKITWGEVKMLRTSYKNREGRNKQCQQKVMCSNS